MYQYIEALIYVYFRKDIKWGQVPYNLRELLNEYLRWSWSRCRAKVTAPAPAKYPGSGRLRLWNSGLNTQNIDFYIFVHSSLKGTFGICSKGHIQQQQIVSEVTLQSKQIHTL